MINERRYMGDWAYETMRSGWKGGWKGVAWNEADDNSPSICTPVFYGTGAKAQAMDEIETYVRSQQKEPTP